MAKTPKVKKRGVSVRSRAARRAASPSLNLDKSLKNIRAPAENIETKGSQRPYSVLGAHGGGITKKRKAKQLSRSQKQRQREGAERADNLAGHLERKLQQAVGRYKNVKTRAGDWEDLNAKIEKNMADDDIVIHQGGVKNSNPFEGLKRDEGREWMPLPEPGEELVLPMMMGRPPPRRTKPTAPKEEEKQEEVVKKDTQVDEIT